ncbi:hypothetical protein GN244_ATG10072 [Phytophthora infestans]|uniref:Retrotransposon gag domain-containing protein n=1 Tax=Phytophthora infestans TaxID=4787 RepID=A0A833WD39_PHYIN|nr:hypothetical protein GN244_ATG10072 [Phytophthora infestans]KAF4135649.1 hypothetical protein GN958_ATG15162 [Phytophthora infestans]
MEKQEDVTHTAPVKFKSPGRFKGTKEVTPFTGGSWKDRSKFQREINRLYHFLDMSDSDRSAHRLREVLGQFLTGRDLYDFFEKMDDTREKEQTIARAIIIAMDSLTARYYPVGTREKLHEEIKALRKTQNMAVTQYSSRFEDLVSLERWILDDDGNPMGESEQCRQFSSGMPRQWQMQVAPQKVRWTNRQE